jgi:hypothetical protein
MKIIDFIYYIDRKGGEDPLCEQATAAGVGSPHRWPRSISQRFRTLLQPVVQLVCFPTCSMLEFLGYLQRIYWRWNLLSHRIMNPPQRSLLLIIHRRIKS